MSKRLDQSSKDLEMSVEQQVPTLMFAAVPPLPHDNRKSWLVRCARAMGWPPRRAKALFYQEARIVTAEEWRTLNQRIDALKAAERRHGEDSHELRETFRVAREGRAVARREADQLGGEATHAGDARQPALDAAGTPALPPEEG